MEYKKLTNYVKALGGIALLLLILCVCVFLFAYQQRPIVNFPLTGPLKTDSIISHVANYVPITFKDDSEGQLALYGEKLIKNTYDYFMQMEKNREQSSL